MFSKDKIPPFCSQLLVVNSAAPDDFRCTVQLFEKEEEEWVPVSEIIPAVAGKNGWATEGRKKEGDGHAPMGVYTLGGVFGYAKEKSDWLKMDYTPASEKLFCVDDSNSALYNQIVSAGDYPAKPWNSAENMLRSDGLYKWGIVVNYNTINPVAGLGSCIFIHIWRNAETGTDGCIAMAEGDLVRILKWLAKAGNPAIYCG